jgi:hypothetical protein
LSSVLLWAHNAKSKESIACNFETNRNVHHLGSHFCDNPPAASLLQTVRADRRDSRADRELAKECASLSRSKLKRPKFFHLQFDNRRMQLDHVHQQPQTTHGHLRIAIPHMRNLDCLCGLPHHNRYDTSLLPRVPPLMIWQKPQTRVFDLIRGLKLHCYVSLSCIYSTALFDPMPSMILPLTITLDLAMLS